MNTGCVFLLDVDNTLLDNGHYAHDPANIARYPAADVSVDRIGGLLGLDLVSRLGAIQETS